MVHIPQVPVNTTVKSTSVTCVVIYRATPCVDTRIFTSHFFVYDASTIQLSIPMDDGSNASYSAQDLFPSSSRQRGPLVRLAMMAEVTRPVDLTEELDSRPRKFVSGPNDLILVNCRGDC
jgi:hypothetical protein